MTHSLNGASPVPAGTYVEVATAVLQAGERDQHIPQDTAATQLSILGRGYPLSAARLGEPATARTFAGRTTEETVADPEPGHDHTFGLLEPEILAVTENLSAWMSAQ